MSVNNSPRTSPERTPPSSPRGRSVFFASNRSRRDVSLDRLDDHEPAEPLSPRTQEHHVESEVPTGEAGINNATFNNVESGRISGADSESDDHEPVTGESDGIVGRPAMGRDDDDDDWGLNYR